MLRRKAGVIGIITSVKSKQDSELVLNQESIRTGISRNEAKAEP